MKKEFVYALLGFCFVTNVFASGYQLALMTSHITRSANYTIGASEVVSEETRSPMEVKFGKVFSNSAYLGVIYDMGSRTVKSATLTRTEKSTGYGITLGYETNKYFAHLNYFLAGEYDFDNNVIFKEASGMQIDLGVKTRFYMFDLVLELAYRSLSYAKRDNNGNEADIESSAIGGIMPQIGLLYKF
jgi:hypothetical protein